MKIALILASLLYGFYITPSEPPCDDLKVKAEVTHTTDGLSNGSVEIEVEGAKSTVYYFFHNHRGYPVSTKPTSSEVKKLKAGEYSCTVITENGCKTKLKINIE